MANRGIPKPPGTPHLSRDDITKTFTGLASINWGTEGLTRHEIKRQFPQLPDDVFLRLPESKRFTSVDEVLRQAGVAESRAEGDFLGPNPDLPEAASIADGGPPGWGGDPIYSVGGVEEPGSAEDTEDLDSSES